MMGIDAVWLLDLMQEHITSGFNRLINISAVDRGDLIEVIYHLEGKEDDKRTVEVQVPKSVPRLPSITGLWEYADQYEKEVGNRIGVIFEGHPELRRIYFEMIEQDPMVIHSPAKEVRWNPDVPFRERRVAHKSPDACLFCGACAGSCPTGTLAISGDSIDVDDSLCVDCGACHHNCPAEDVRWGDLLKRVHGDIEVGPMGIVLSARMGRAMDSMIADRGQHGGAATAILIGLIEAGDVDAAIVTLRETDWLTYPQVGRSVDRVAGSVGLKPLASPVLSALSSTVDEGLRVAVAGLPCHIRGLRSIEWGLSSIKARRLIGPALAVFCPVTYHRSVLGEFHREGLPPEAIMRLIHDEDGGLTAETYDGSTLKIGNDRVAPHRRSCCSTCHDHYGEFADIAVGGDKAPEGWSTILVRTESGEKALNKTYRSGHLELRELDEKVLKNEFS